MAISLEELATVSYGWGMLSDLKDSTWDSPDSADDEPMVSKFLREYLQSQGHTVDVTVDWEEALDLVQSVDFDCFLASDGLRWLEQANRELLRSVGQQGDLHYSRYDQPQNPCTVVSHRNPVLLKPFELQELRGGIQSVIGGPDQRYLALQQSIPLKRSGPPIKSGIRI